ncbi:MAG: hypothetical protein ACLVAA_05700 [Ruthenibacterium sp.]
MKKLFAACLSLCLAAALFAVPAFAAGDVAQVEGGQAYGTLQEAIDEAQTSGKVTLLKDTQENITIPAGKSIELVLNANLTNQSDHTIVVKNGATLTISGSGTVDNVTHQRAAIHNEVGGTVFLNGGTYTRSKENGINSANSGGNSFYNIRNYGTMTINKGVEVVQNGQFSSLIENGFYNGAKDNPTKATATMIINGGTFSGGINTIKNDDYGVLTIHDGTFSNTTQAAFLNWNVATVNGGTFSSEQNCILNGYGDDTMDKGELKITGGTFTSKEAPIKRMNEKDEDFDKVDVTGGVYSGDVSEVVAAGSSELVKASGDNRFVVNASTDKPESATTRTEKNGAVVYFEDVDQALKDSAANDINVVADAEISVNVPKGVKVTVASGVTLTAKGDLSGVTFSDGAKLVVPEGQTATVGGKEYASGSYEAQKDGTLSKPETKPEEKPAEPAAPAPAPAKANPKTGVRA